MTRPRKYSAEEANQRIRDSQRRYYLANREKLLEKAKEKRKLEKEKKNIPAGFDIEQLTTDN